MTSILTRSIIEISEHLQSGLLTSTELLNLCLERVKKTECLNAFITITEELARKQATNSDERYKKRKRLGMLDGIPIAVKDNFNIMGVRTTCGSNMLKNYISPYNATVIQRLCNQGAVIIGKTNMDEFAMGSGTIDSIFGPTKNPYYSGLKFKLIHRNSINDTHLNTAFCKKYGVENDWYISGGSSGGSAVALTTGTCFGYLKHNGHKAKNYASMADSYAASRHEGFSEVVRGRILAGNYFLLKENYEKYFVQAMKVRRLILNDFQNIFKKGIDFLLTPVTLTDAPLYSNWITKDNREQVSVEDFCTQPVNMAGIPAVSLPCGFSNKGLPLSLQIIGQSFQEKKLLIIAKWLEQQLNFPLWDLNE
ncbi:LOW QUALITY PROTEIN: glutamyl-tRNA(Gln) amidotransferase subunit A, mitochondrial-like [Centruroides sculpturatus]|uniref:LOW QUALITY PROTEIN: glutamyl-tRNA(Gln) amidotransferase subunit A, mitochondrial-like n=1 Tax=Centruroides sculpturatus TaxID=218467 RepID=UPI000C6DAD41|nr:LOW QUALITY PROTEIN: glutamyl-tRNA(Gln) amidotransferase subunit A, mitochondrial-like [Centruroides sculpturatus]